MNKKPLVCICIPCFNNEKTIKETLDSLINQTYKNIIIKIIDNASTDNTVKIIREYELKYNFITVYENEVNIGAEANFTKCIRELEGEFAGIYHADDIYNATIIETQVSYLLEKDISAIFVRANLIDENSNFIGEQFFPKELKNKEYHQFDFSHLFSLILKYDNFLITPSVMARTYIYKNIISHWNGNSFKSSADLDVWLRFSEYKDIGIITSKLISYRISNSSYSYRTKFNRFVQRDMFLVIDYYLEKYEGFNFEDYEYLKFKDSLIVINNKILNGHNVIFQDIEIKKALFKRLTDVKKMKIIVYGLILKFLLFFKLKKILYILIKKINKI